MRRFRWGLVVGKFAPLHHGHQLVIDTARAACELVLVLSYSKPEFVGCEPAKRRAWLQALYPDVLACVLEENGLERGGLALPHNAAPAEEHREFCAKVCHEHLGIRVDAVFTSEDYGEPFARALTAYYRAHTDPDHTVTHVPVDPGRVQIPVSGTLLRSDLFSHRRFMDPKVYASTVRRIAFLGGESTGKTTLTRAVAAALATEHVEEYGRELWLQRGGELDEAALSSIAREQIRREDAALLKSREVLCCDTSPLTTLIYSQLWFGRATDELRRLAEREYDLLVLCEPDFPFVQDGTRSTPEFQRRQHTLTLAELERRGLHHLSARGSFETRVQEVLRAVRDEQR